MMDSSSSSSRWVGRTRILDWNPLFVPCCDIINVYPVWLGANTRTRNANSVSFSVLRSSLQYEYWCASTVGRERNHGYVVDQDGGLYGYPLFRQKLQTLMSFGIQGSLSIESNVYEFAIIAIGL
jgi:hypothetical protein